MRNVNPLQGFEVRSAVYADLAAVVELIQRCEMVADGEAETTLEDIQVEWNAAEFELERDTWVVFAPEGQLVAHAGMRRKEHAEFFMFSDVHPEYRRRGIGTYLLQVAEEYAVHHSTEADPTVSVTLITSKSERNAEARNLFVKRGFQQARSYWRMTLGEQDVPAAARWAEGIQVKTFQPEMAFAIYEADEEAFQDHWGHLSHTYEEWERWSIKREGFDPSLWFLAMDGEQIAGLALCKDEHELGGWVHVLAVRRPWRRRGLGEALLQHAFGEFYRRGIKNIHLGVDSQNLTGATRLYKRVGMHADKQIDRYEKELRAGKKISVQGLDE